MNQAKKRTLTALALVAGAVMLASSLLLPTAAEAQTGITTTKHNLGTTAGAPAGSNQFSGTDEICVFCHTPHGGATGAGNPPLWNKLLPTNGVPTAYTLYSSTTMDAGRATDGISGNPSIGSVSIACLSCHDGSLAINAVINAPGSGLTNALYTAGTWTAATSGTPVDPATGQFGTGIANLGRDLSNDHPIGIQYCGGGYTTASATGVCADADFNAPSSGLIGGTTRVFWVNTDADTTTRTKADLTLYNRDFGAGGVGPSVECASCHDPHTTTVTFLRKQNTGSALCLSCHKK